MFMIVSYPWPVPSANLDPAGLRKAVAAAHPPDAMAETGTPRPWQIDELVSWTFRERLRLLWYRLRLTACASDRVSRRSRRSRLKLP
jgi:hypothetical protein